MKRDDAAEPTIDAIATSTGEPGTPDHMTRRVFLERLQRTATFVAPVVAAVLLTPSKALAGS